MSIHLIVIIIILTGLTCLGQKTFTYSEPSKLICTDQKCEKALIPHPKYLINSNLNPPPFYPYHFPPWSQSNPTGGQSKLDLFNPQLQVTEMTHPPPSIGKTSIIEGTGPYLCILRSSSELLSGVTSVFIRDVGYYHCSFQDGRRLKRMVFGAGFYHCIYQRPGVQISVRQGVGQYFCFYQGIRYTKNFIDLTPPPGTHPMMMMMEKRNFLEFLASVNYAVPGGSDGTNLGQFQLLAMYNYGPERSGRNFGLFQATEAFNIGLESLTKPSGFITVEDGVRDSGGRSIDTKRSEVEVNQLGIYQYHFNGPDIDHGKGDRFQNFMYNFVHELDAHIFTFLVSRYEFIGQGQSFRDDLDFVQLWGLYSYDLKANDPDPSTLPSILNAIIMVQYDLARSDIEIDSGGLDNVQLILQYNEAFHGYGPLDTGSLVLTGIYQGNYNEAGVSLEEFQVDYFLGIFQLRYVFLGVNPKVNGFVQLTVIYQQFVGPMIMEGPPGYIQILGQYGKNYNPILFGLPCVVTWTVQAIAEYVFPDEELCNGFLKLQGQIVMDTTGVLSTGQSSITFLTLEQCIWFGKRMLSGFCYIQLYAFYQGDIAGKGEVNPGQGVLLCQFYQEL